MQNEKRMPWIDFCRGITMILVVIGHTIAIDTTIRFTIFTFHMPILFVIAGYVFHPVEVKNAIVKYSKKLLLPLYAGSIMLFLYRMVMAYLLHVGWEDYKYWMKRSVIATIFASGVSSPRGFPEVHSLGMIWFLAAMFWAMLFFNVIINCTERGNKRQCQIVFCIIITGMGYLLGTIIWPPMNVDLSMVSVGYLCVGYRMKKAVFFVPSYFLHIHIALLILFLIICFPPTQQITPARINKSFRWIKIQT